MMRREHHLGVGKARLTLEAFEDFGLCCLVGVGVVGFLVGLGCGCFCCFLGFRVTKAP
jgi:hypothetical protein